ncbi:hypothetical protein RIF29_15359 [Crotalaria pallida]|uniref:Uncharacterized protein n=1 Tax=Crotalaria pallida TaxID=3830 RepID=A0AAN9FH39_CROPI
METLSVLDPANTSKWSVNGKVAMGDRGGSRKRKTQFGPQEQGSNGDNSTYCNVQPPSKYLHASHGISLCQCSCSGSDGSQFGVCQSPFVCGLNALPPAKQSIMSSRIQSLKKNSSNGSSRENCQRFAQRLNFQHIRNVQRNSVLSGISSLKFSCSTVCKDISNVVHSGRGDGIRGIFL